MTTGYDGEPLSSREARCRLRSNGALRVLALELTGRTEAPEILRSDRFHRIRGDAEPFQRQACGLCRVRHHIVVAQELDLVGRQLERAWRELQERRLDFRKGERQ